MRPIKEQQQETARNLFFQSGKTRAEIAEAVGVSERTITLWTKAGDWKRLRSASKLMPSLIVENFYSQIQELNEDIRNREPGKRYPSVQEAEIFRKLTVTAERLKKGHTQGEYSEMMQKFMSWLTPQSHEHLQLFTTYADRFLKSRSPDGFAPYDIEYSAIEPPLPKKPEYNSTSLSGACPAASGREGRGEALLEPNSQHVTPSPFMEKGPGDEAEQETIVQKRELSPGHQQEIISQRPEITRNNSEQSYEAATNTSSENTGQKQEITHDSQKEEITQIDNTSLSLGEGRGEASLAQDNTVEIGYLGIKQKPEPGGGVMIELQQSDPDIQKFSIGEAIYYVRRKG